MKAIFYVFKYIRFQIQHPVLSLAPVPRVLSVPESRAPVPRVAAPNAVPAVAVVDAEDAPDPDRVLVVDARDVVLLLPMTPSTGTKTLTMGKRSTLATSIIGFV